MRPLLYAIALAVLVAGSSACSPGRLAPPAISVAIEPPTATVGPFGQARFSATVTGGAATAVAWSVQESGGGVVDAAGVYTAPATPGAYHVVASSAEDPGQSAVATVTVHAATSSVAVAVSPRAATLPAGGAQQFEAAVTGAAPGQSGAVTWSVLEGAAGGSIDAAGLYRAAAAGGTAHVRAASVADPAAADGATLTILPPSSSVQVAVSPSTAVAAAGQSVAFTATVTGAAPAQSGAVTWSVREAAGGAVNASGRYTAPATAGVFHVVATSVADPARSAAAAVTVSPPLSVQVLPASAALLTSGAVDFTAAVSGGPPGQSTAVTWSVLEAAGGTIDGKGHYLAPAAAGTFTVMATSQSDGSKAGQARAVVSLPSSVDSTGLIPADRITRWKPGIPGDVPVVTAVAATVDAATYGNGTTDATAALNAALQAAGDLAASTGARQVVALPAGKYRLGGTVFVNRSDVVLRGAGPAATQLVVDHAGAGLYLGREADYPDAAGINLSGSVGKGSQTFQLSNAAAAQVLVGDVLEIDQADPPAALLPSGHVYTNGYVWFGDGHYFKRQPTGDFNGPGTGAIPYLYPPPSDGNPAGWARDPALSTWDNGVNYNERFTGPNRSVGQQVEIAGKAVGATSTTFTITGVFHIAFDAARAPQLWHTGTRWTRQRPSMPGTQDSGIEDLLITGGPGGAGNDNGIVGRNLADCWIRNVTVDGQLIPGDASRPGLGGPLVVLAHAFRTVVRDSYVHHTSRMLSNAGSYGVVFDNHSTDNLIENNIVLWMGKPIMFDASGGGNVVGYNYVDQAIIDGTSWQENALDGCHETFCMFDLYEGNEAPNLGSDSTHGNAGWLTFFRNYATGRNSIPYNIGSGQGLPLGNLRAAGMDAWSGPSNFVGNVLTAVDLGNGVTYQLTGTAHASAMAPVYRLGDNGSGGSGGAWDDGTAAANAYRHANYDNVNLAVVYDPAASRRDLPNSLYLTAKPAFFGSLPWPWVDPAGTPRTGTLPARQRYEGL